MNKDALPPLKVRRPVSDLEHIFAELKRSFMIGEFEPDQRITLPKLAEAFGTSQMPIREATNRLIVARALEASPRRSLRVPKATADRLDKLLPLRLSLEGEATRLAVPACTAATVAELQAINERMDAALHAGSPKSYLKLNQKFHFKVYRRCGNEDLVDLIELLWMRYGPLMSIVRSGALSKTGHVHHEAVVAAIAARDPEGAAEALRNDIADAAAEIRGAIVQPAAA